MQRIAAALLVVLGAAGLAEAARLPKPISLVQRQPKTVHTHPYIRGNRFLESTWGVQGNALSRTMRQAHLTHGVRGD